MSEDGTNGAAAESGGRAEDPHGTIDALRREAEDSWNKYVRTAAELDNFRKRSAREVEMARKFGIERLAQGLLPVRDSLEAGLAASATAERSALVEGQEATLRLLDQALTEAGVREIDPVGHVFDPNKHEALSMMPVPGAEPNTVVEVVQKGYELNERILRAAKVIVARAAD